MPTPFESAQLLLTLYDQRREETMRKARDFFMGFDPQTFEEYMAGAMGPNGGYVRMVVSYWDMAASFVAHGAIDANMFYDTAGGEFTVVYGKVEPFLAPMREAYGNPGFGANMEKVAMGMPNARERIDGTRERVRGMLKARAAAASN